MLFWYPMSSIPSLVTPAISNVIIYAVRERSLLKRGKIFFFFTPFDFLFSFRALYFGRRFMRFSRSTFCPSGDYRAGQTEARSD